MSLVDGEYSDWGAWSACDQPCGSGHKLRVRSCSNPEPQFGGMNCTGLGPEIESVACNTDPCPGTRTSMSCTTSMCATCFF